MTEKMLVYTDGAARGNPGPAAIGVVIADGRGRVLREISRAIGRATNNRAEYLAVIAGLEAALGMGAGHVELRTDSELVARQLSGLYRVRDQGLRPLFLRARELLESFPSFSVSHVRREDNSRADALANRALDSSAFPR